MPEQTVNASQVIYGWRKQSRRRKQSKRDHHFSVVSVSSCSFKTQSIPLSQRSNHGSYCLSRFLSYAVMPNHWHLGPIAKPSRRGGQAHFCSEDSAKMSQSPRFWTAS
jgi:hypothetical protein